MEEKQLLITSMQKLLKHIGTNKKNQEDIFKSLSNIDLTKIVSNLDDPSLQLRQTSYQLIISLLFDNYALKKQFCQKIGVGEMKGRIILNSKMLSSISLGLADLLKTLKQPLTNSQSSYTAWYINLTTFPRKIQYLTHINNFNKAIDPKENLVGIILPQASIYLLKNEGPIINNLIQTSNNLQKNIHSNYSDQQLNKIPILTHNTNSYQSYQKRQQPGYSHKYTANTINNYNTHNNYFTIVPNKQSPIKHNLQGFKQLNQITTKDSKDSLKQYKQFKDLKQFKTKEGPISIKKLNAYTGKNTSYPSKNQTHQINMYQSTDFPADRNQINNKSYMATSYMVNNSYNMANSVEQISGSSSLSYGNNGRIKPVSVIIRDSQRPQAYSQIITQRNNTSAIISNQNLQNNINNSSQAFHLQIKNRYLQSPIQSVPDRNIKTTNNNSFNYYQKY